MTTTARHTQTTARLVLAAVVGALALLATGAHPATAATSAALEPTNTCWRDVVNDWFDNNQVDGIYAIPCYTQAIQHLSKFADVSGYSSAEDDIRNALLAALRQDRGGGGISGGPGGPTSGPSSSNDPNGPGGPSTHNGPLVDAIDSGTPSDAQSVPLPLLVLGGLALLLLLTAGGAWLARRIQARRMTPAPSPLRRS